jgi:hypothetical protein
MRRKLVKVEELYAKSRDALRRLILSEKPEAEELNIISHYKRSTRILGNYVTLDWQHKNDIQRLMNVIKDYSDDSTRKRPLNIFMIAQPGIGKSHFINQLAQKISSPVGAVSFNMANLNNIEDLIQPLDSARNMKVLDSLPILFLDEVDSKSSNYSLLLPLLWDGEFHIGHRDLKLGKIVIIMAGSDTRINKIIESTESMEKDLEIILKNLRPKLKEHEKKLIDLLSRINGGILKIPDLDKVEAGRDRPVDKICITISLLLQRFGDQLQLVPWRLLNFIGKTNFRYGVRSISNLIDLIPWTQKDPYDRLLNDELNLPLDSLVNINNSGLVRHLISTQGPEHIVKEWKKFNKCNSLVRFASEPVEEET